MDHEEIIARTVDHVKQELKDAEGGHDWWHIERVWKTAITIGKKENADLQVVELAALLHDIADSKFHNGDESIGPKKAQTFLRDLKLKSPVIHHVVEIIKSISYKGGHNRASIDTVEFKVVQDADRLDAIGAIGIARAFSFGGYKNRELYNPSIRPNLNMSREEYKKSTSPTINHFYEKLLLLKERMNTSTGKAMAQERHEFMEKFLDQFYKEWEGAR